MGNVIPELQPLAWTLNRPLPAELRTVKGLALPAPIRTSLSRLQNIDQLKSPPLSSLYDALGALAPEILAFTPNYFKDKPDDLPDVWLYALSSEQINISKLYQIIVAWLGACYGTSFANGLDTQWKTEGIHWNAWQTFDMDTASERLQSLVLPGMIAHWLISNGYQLHLPTENGGRSFSLHRVPLMTMRGTADLMTEPQAAKKGGLYSFVVRLWVEKLPHSLTLCLFPQLSMRRWRTKPLWSGKNKQYLDMQLKRNKSIYWRRVTGYLSNTPRVPVYTRLRLRCTHYNAADGVKWLGFQRDVLSLLTKGETLPTAFELACEPQDFTKNLLIVTHAGTGETHEVKTGLWSNDHRAMFEGLDRYIKQIGTRLPVVRNTRTTRTWKFPKVDDERKVAALLALHEPLAVEVYADDVQEIKTHLLSEVGLFDGVKHRLADNPLDIWHETRLLFRVQGMNSPLVTELLPESVTSKKARKRANDQRERALEKVLPPPAMITGALIKLINYSDTPMKLRDPKSAARFGLLRTGRLTKFLVPRKRKPKPEDKSDEYQHRLTSAIRALLGALGYRTKPLYAPPSGARMPIELDIIGFWVIRLNRGGKQEKTVTLPLVAEARFGETHVRVSLPGTDGQAVSYYSLREAVLAAQAFNGDFSEPERCLAFFRSVLKNRPPQRAGLLILPDQNLRRVFAELTVQTSEVSLEGLLDEYPHLRVVRLRSSTDGEAPMCVPPVKGSRWIGVYATEHPAIFYSLYSRETGIMTLNSRKMDRLDQAAVNASTLQIWLQRLAPDDNPAEWATLVHRLRKSSAHTDVATRLVQPLHDVDTVMRDYLPHAVKSEGDEDNDDEEAE